MEKGSPSWGRPFSVEKPAKQKGTKGATEQLGPAHQMQLSGLGADPEAEWVCITTSTSLSNAATLQCGSVRKWERNPFLDGFHGLKEKPKENQPAGGLIPNFDTSPRLTPKNRACSASSGSPAQRSQDKAPPKDLLSKRPWQGHSKGLMICLQLL